MSLEPAVRGSLRERLQNLIAQEPGQTERELTARLCGVAAGPGQINFWCKLLVDREVIRRSGSGGRLDPYRYEMARNEI